MGITSDCAVLYGRDVGLSELVEIHSGGDCGGEKMEPSVSRPLLHTYGNHQKSFLPTQRTLSVHTHSVLVRYKTILRVYTRIRVQTECEEGRGGGGR